jgi:hypothetical protein
MRYTRGIGWPAAIAISATTFMSCLTPGPAPSASTGRAKLDASTAWSPKR